MLDEFSAAHRAQACSAVVRWFGVSALQQRAEFGLERSTVARRRKPRVPFHRIVKSADRNAAACRTSNDCTAIN